MGITQLGSKAVQRITKVGREYMNRETSIHSSDTLVVVDRSRRNRQMIVAAAVVVALLLLAVVIIGRSSSHKDAAGSGKGAGQMPTVTVVVPGRSEVARIVTASGPLAAKRDQPIGIAGTGGRVSRVLADAGTW